MHVTVYPTADEGSPPIVKTSNSSKVKARVARTPVGYRANVAIPLSAFLKDREEQSVIGFDLLLVSYDGKGAQTAHLSWTGRSGQEWDVSKLAKLLLPR